MADGAAVMAFAMPPDDQAYAASRLEPLTPAAAEALRTESPTTLGAYLEWLRRFGWGSLDGALMLYSGPIPLREVLGDRSADTAILAIGDDLAGYVVGLDPTDQRVFEFDPAGREVGCWPDLDQFIAERVSQIRADLAGRVAQ